MKATTYPRSIALSIGIAAVLSLSAPVDALAQSQPIVDRSADLQVPTTKILAIGKFSSNATPAIWRPHIDAAVRQTVALYLGGKIEQWWVRPDQTGVVFLFASDDPKDVQAMLDALPLGRAGLMEFELIPLGPLSPLRLLLKQPSP